MKHYILLIALMMTKNLTAQDKFDIVKKSEINVIQFTDDQTGYLAGGYSIQKLLAMDFSKSSSQLMMKTTDGGKTWSKLDTRTLTDINDLYFLTQVRE